MIPKSGNRFSEKTMLKQSAAQRVRKTTSLSALDTFCQKKGRLRCKRPKSREETPKEGGGNEREPVAALQQYACATHKMQAFLNFSSHGCS
jgi:hypothetical protein